MHPRRVLQDVRRVPPFDRPQRRLRHVAMATLHDGPTLRPTGPIFAGSRAPWFTISDGLPHCDVHIVASTPEGG
jgi:hypothetical protein